MAILACHIPDFPLALLARHEPQLYERPLALLDTNERLIAATPAARAAGVSPGLDARQAAIRCPELSLQPFDAIEARRYEAELLAVLDCYSDTVEAAGLGQAYVQTPVLRPDEILPYCQEIGRQVRQRLGALLQPALGCDRSKFTAGLAARHTLPGRVRMIDASDEQRFLHPLPIHLLPLPPADLELLQHLGIRTLGQFAALPARAVYQQFGPAGRLAQQWAQGRDNRPLVPHQQARFLQRSHSFDPPIAHLPPLLATAQRLLDELLAPLRRQLQAVHTLHAVLHWQGTAPSAHTWPLAEPSSDARYLLHLLQQHWQTSPWPAPLTTLELILADIQEAPAGQLTLFPGDGAPAALLQGWVQDLRQRYGEGALLQATVPDAGNLHVEQRVQWQEFAA